MGNQKFSKSQAFHFGWETTWSHFGFFFVLLLLWISIGGSLWLILDILTDESFGINIFLFLILEMGISIPLLVMDIGLVKISLNFCDQKKGRWRDLFSGYPLLFKYLRGAILYQLIVLGGTILFIIPGIIWGIKFQFFSYFIVDQKIGPWEALKKSAKITKGQKWNLFLFNLLSVLINIAGVLLILVGFWVTFPTILVAQAFVYRRLLSFQETGLEKEISSVKIGTEAEKPLR